MQLLFLLMMLLMFQQPLDLRYGDVIYDEISDQTPAHDYFFQGQAGDVVAIIMQSRDRELDTRMNTPVLMLFSAEGELLADTTLAYPIDDALIVAELPDDGTYRIHTTRDENVAVLAQGEFSLELWLIPELTEPLEAEINMDDFGQFYVARPEADFRLEYTRLSGEFTPQVTVNRIGYSRLQPIATAYGEVLTEATLGVFPPGETYIIMLNTAPFDHDFEPTSALYRLILN